MDLGVVSFDGLVGSETGYVPFGSGFLKHQRSEEEVVGEQEEEVVNNNNNNNNNTRRGAKSSKIITSGGVDDDDVITTTTSKRMLFFQNHRRNNNNNNSSCNVLLRSNNNNNGNDNVAIALFNDGGGEEQEEEKMLSFSQKSETLIVEKASSNATLHTSYHPFSSYTINNAGYNNSNWGMNMNMNMMMMGNNSNNNNVGRVLGAALFTPSQWMELEHQALIYKYITANVPVPSHLLIPIRKALDSTSAFCNFPNALLRPNALGWGGFHLGFSSSTDPEPGRCRRTDGKKWRCSRDAVVDQKYCERHMNRGRHRSRKPVEGQSGHAAALTTAAVATTTATATTTSNSKPLLPNSNNNSCSSFSIVGNTTASNNNSNTISFGNCHEHKNVIMQQQPPPLASDDSAANNISRMFMKKENNNNNANESSSSSLLAMLPQNLDLKPKENPFMIHNNNNHEFGLLSCDSSLLNPCNNKANDDSQNHSLRHFIDESTQLSISIPNHHHQFLPTNNEKVMTLSPLRVSSRELELELVDPIQMGLGVGIGVNNNNNNNNIVRQPNWIPISWESSMGGPLGEALNLSNGNNNNNNNNNKGSLNLISSDGWDNSPSIGSSPTGVLQKTTAFGSLSNSSAGSSPRAENNKGGAIL